MEQTINYCTILWDAVINITSSNIKVDYMKLQIPDGFQNTDYAILCHSIWYCEFSKCKVELDLEMTNEDEVLQT